MASYINAFMTIETTDPDEIERVLDHHIDYLIDMDSNRDIKSIYGVKSYNAESKRDTPKIDIIASVLSDIDTNLSRDDMDNMDDEMIDVYNNLRNLKESLKLAGLI